MAAIERARPTGGEARDRESLAAELRHRLGPPPASPASPPLVSIVVVSRDGADHLRLLLAGLAEATDYPHLELIVVDNDSGDDSLDLLRGARTPFPISIVANVHNESFSEACNQGAALARGELLLFLNNDTEPFEAGWLAELVACQRRTGAGIVGTTLLYRDERLGHRHGYAVQHRGMRFLDEEGMLRADLHGYRDDPFDESFGADREAPVVTASCMLVERELFERVGGFWRGYRYGVEDTDLGLRVRAAGGAVVNSGRAFVIHRPGSTRRAAPLEQRRALQARNRRLLMELWGPRIRREYELDRLERRGLWAEPGAWAPPRSREELMRLGFCVALADPDGATVAAAEALGAELARRGHRSLTLRGEAVDDPVGLNCDVAVHLRGVRRHVPRPAQLNVLWAVGPDVELTDVECERYDLVLASAVPPRRQLLDAEPVTPVIALGAAAAGDAIDAVGARAREVGLPLLVGPGRSGAGCGDGGGRRASEGMAGRWP